MPEPRACPVCSEPLTDTPQRCFRCETPLAAWWPFEVCLEQSVDGLGRAVVVGPVSKASLALGSRYPALAAAAAVGAALALLSAFAVFQARLEASRSVLKTTGIPLVLAVSTEAPSSASPAEGPAVVATQVPASSSIPNVLVTTSAGGARPRGAEPTSIAPLTSYRVQRGDSLWRIAAALTGDGRRWRQLWPELEGRWLRPGTVLVLPASQTAPAHD